MSKNLYIDASHPDETRIVLKSNITIEEYEFEDKNRINFKCIYFKYFFVLYKELKLLLLKL